MKRITLGIVTVVMFGTLFSMATGYALWQVVQLNALLSLSPLPESPAPAVSESEGPADIQPIKQAVYVTVESGGSPGGRCNPARRVRGD